VLGGGGAAGNAWLIGVMAGLADADLDVTDADLIVGTSAGATAAVQVTNSPLSTLYAAIVSAPAPAGAGRVTPHAAGGGAGGGAGSAAGAVGRDGGLGGHLERTDRIIAASLDLADMRRRIGAAALAVDATSDGSPSRQWRATAETRLPGVRWPTTRLLLTAVDARTGEPIEFDADSGIDLIDAVAASTSGGPSPYRLGDERYIDGGYRRSSENADLAAGYERVLVLSPLGGRTRHPLSWGSRLAVQIDELRAGGSRVEALLPDAASRAAFGDSMMNLAARIPTARTGHAQGGALASSLAEFWEL